MPSQIRVSLGSTIVLGLLKGKLEAVPTTAYLMTYRNSKCTANCSFCPQARESSSRTDMLSRVSWPVFPTEHVLDGLERTVEDGKIKRVCIQALNYPEVLAHLTAITRTIHERTRVPISVSCQPLTTENIRRLADAGAEYIGISLDAATEALFNKVKGVLTRSPYNWEKQFKLLQEAVDVFGKGKVSTHLIVGLGETEREMVETMQRCVDMGVLPSLFAFTPIRGTALEDGSQPSIQAYRRIQIARHLIVREIVRYENMRFGEEERLKDFGVGKETLWRIIHESKPFITSGCPDCNRPYYNEKPSGPLYNYPTELREEEFSEVKRQLGLRGA